MSYILGVILLLIACLSLSDSNVRVNILYGTCILFLLNASLIFSLIVHIAISEIIPHFGSKQKNDLISI